MPPDYGNDKAMNSLKKQSRIAALYFLNGLTVLQGLRTGKTGKLVITVE